MSVLKLALRRLLVSIPLLLAITAATFFLVFNSPGNYADFLKSDKRFTQQQIEQDIKKLGLDKPWYMLWGRYVTGVITRGDLGKSFVERDRPVARILGESLFATFLLALSSTVFAWSLAVPLGIVAAVNKDGPVDRIASGLAFVGLAVPGILLAIGAIYLAAVTGWFPVGKMTSNDHYKMTSVWDRAADIGRHLILPTIVLGSGGLAVYSRQMRSNLVETMNAEYVRTAIAKGVGRGAAIRRHAVPNALNPLITMFGFALSELLSGAFIVENVMDWPGLGRKTMEAYGSKDVYVIVGTVALSSVMLILGNLIADVLLAWNDPRIRYED